MQADSDLLKHSHDPKAYLCHLDSRLSQADPNDHC